MVYYRIYRQGIAEVEPEGIKTRYDRNEIGGHLSPDIALSRIDPPFTAMVTDIVTGDEIPGRMIQLPQIRLHLECGDLLKLVRGEQLLREARERETQEIK